MSDDNNLFTFVDGAPAVRQSRCWHCLRPWPTPGSALKLSFFQRTDGSRRIVHDHCFDAAIMASARLIMLPPREPPPLKQ